MFDIMTPIISQHIYVSQQMEIETTNIKVIHFKQNASLMPNQFKNKDNKISFTLFCDLLNSLSCSNRTITQRSMIMTSGLTGLNGDNETNIGSSNSLEFSIYDEQQTEIIVKNQDNSINIWIPKNVQDNSFELINVTLNSSNGGQFINGMYVNGFNLNGANQSIHIQLKPNNFNISYLVLVKFGENPTLKSYDLSNIFCPQDLNAADNVYLTFANISRVNGYKGYVGYSILELNSTNCFNKSLYSIQNLNGSFSDNFWLRVFTSGCYYMDTITNKWSSYGMEILSDSNDTHFHCQSNHLTTFAGGFLVLPNAINFDYVWSHASFTQNPVIYCTVIVLIFLYIFFGILSRWMDIKDEAKCGITILNDFKGSGSKKYVYEICVFTGLRMNAGTKSKVNKKCWVNCIIFT